MPKDPAQTFAERRRRVEALIESAEMIEADESLGAERLAQHLTRANNYRLQAICEDLGLQAPPESPPPAEPEGEDPAVPEWK